MSKKDSQLELFGSKSVVTFAPEEARAGFEHVTQRDIGIPTLVKLEKNSRYLDPDNKDYTPVEGAEKGNVLLTPANTLYKSGAQVVPFGYCRSWTEMKPRGAGGGFVASHMAPPVESSTIEVQGRNVLVMPNGNELKETATFGVLVRSAEGDWTPAVVRMQGMSLRTARQWINIALATGKPLYASGYTLSAEADKNELGSFQVWKVILLGAIQSQELADRAKEQHALFSRVFMGAATPVVEEAY